MPAALIAMLNSQPHKPTMVMKHIKLSIIKITILGSK